MADETRVFDAMQEHVGDAEHVRELLFLHGAEGLHHFLLVLGLFDVAVAHVAEGAGEKAAGAAGGVEEDFAGAGIDAVHHEGGDGAGGVVFAGVAGGLEVVEELLVDVAEVLALGEVVEVHGADLVDDLAHELAGLHVVVGVFEDVADDAAAVGLAFAGGAEGFEPGEELGVDEGLEFVAGDAFGVGGPGAPLEGFGDGGAIVRVHQLKLLVLVVDDFEEEHPAELGDALGVAIDADVLAHDVLDGFNGVADGHGVKRYAWCVVL